MNSCKFLVQKIVFYTFLLIFGVLIQNVSATIISIPSDYLTIQEGINASSSGDTILVDEGTYYENIRFFGKGILVTSKFMLDNNPSHIFNTVLDGSNPQHPDTASVVRMIDSEDSTSIIQGFTITNGTGTEWPDPHGAGDYREGGGILTEFASPIIQYNYIVNNEAVQFGAGIISAGGGGIRSGDGNPHIRNNIIMHNKGRYGAGIVLNYAEGDITNNVIAYNTGGEDFAGSGIWKYQGSNANVENNTIAFNESVLSGGGIYVWASSMTIKNNIIRGNIAPAAAQIRTTGATTNATYNNVEDGYTGTGNIDVNAEFIGEFLYISKTSPCIDAGAPFAINPEQASDTNATIAKWPSRGVPNSTDMGAYGNSKAFSFEELILYADTTLGWAPLDVSINAESIHDQADSISISLGDGNTSNSFITNHTYTTNGTFDIHADLYANGNIYTKTNQDYVSVIADSIYADTVLADPGEISFITIYANNSIPINEIVLPVEYTNGLSFTIDSISTVGCRTEYFESVKIINLNLFSRRLTYSLKSSVSGTQPPLEPGSGAIAKLYVTVSAGASFGQSTEISVDGYDTYLSRFTGPLLEYLIEIKYNGLLSVAPCCEGFRGNIDADILEIIDISDLVYLVDFMFTNGPDPLCKEEANFDGDIDEIVDITDLVALVSFLFDSGPGPVNCPN